MKSSKMLISLVATMIFILSISISASAQTVGRIGVPAVSPAPLIPELVPYLRQYQNLPITNVHNPYEWVGQYHNAALDYLGVQMNNPANAARFSSPTNWPFPWPWPGNGSPGPYWPYPDLLWNTNLALFKPYAPTDVFEQVGLSRNIFSTEKSASFARIGLHRNGLTDKEQADFDEFNFQLTGLAKALGSGRLGYQDFQRRVIELENTALVSNNLSSNVRMRVLLATTVARHSAYYHMEGPAAARKKCPDCAEADIGGATVGASVGGIWGAIIGAVAMSAMEYFLN